MRSLTACGIGAVSVLSILNGIAWLIAFHDCLA